MPVSFESDYIAGAHPEILRRLAETNLESLPGYGADPYCESAKKKILEACGLEQGEVEFLTGGTQANAVVISTMLADHEGVVAAATGHISSHEAGAIEYTGHEVLELPQENGKIRPETLRRFLSDFFADGNHDHMTFPGMVYLSWPTEYGTLYTKEELEAVSGICREYGIPLFLDGARLAYGLMSRSADLTLPDIDGQLKTLSDMEGKVIILSFWSVGQDEHKLFNVDLAEIYAKYHERGLEVYQVGLDIDKPSWAAVVKSQKLPWTSVNDGLGVQSPAVISYNVDHVPTMFVIDRKGDIAARDVFDETALDQLVRKLL